MYYCYLGWDSQPLSVWLIRGSNMQHISHLPVIIKQNRIMVTTMKWWVSGLNLYTLCSFLDFSSIIYLHYQVRMYDHLISKGLNYISSWSYVSMACFIKVFKHVGDPVKAVLYGKMKGAQYSYSELEKSRVASIWFVWKKTKIF